MFVKFYVMVSRKLQGEGGECVGRKPLTMKLLRNNSVL
jgi:hypothetical protein